MQKYCPTCKKETQHKIVEPGTNFCIPCMVKIHAEPDYHIGAKPQ